MSLYPPPDPTDPTLSPARPMPQMDTGFDLNRMFSGLGLGLSSLAGPFGNSPALSHWTQQEMEHQRDQQGFQQASQAIAWASQDAKGDASKELQNLGRFLNDSGVSSPVAMKLLTNRMAQLEGPARAAELQQQEQGFNLKADMLGQGSAPRLGSFDPGAGGAAGGPQGMAPFTQAAVGVSPEVASPQAATALQDYQTTAAQLRALGMQPDMIKRRIGGPPQMPNAAEIPFKVAEYEALTGPTVARGAAERAATDQAALGVKNANWPTELTQQGEAATQKGQIASAQKLTDLRGPLGDAEFLDWKNRQVEGGAIRSRQELIDLAGPVGAAKIAQDVKREEALMPARQAMADYQKRATIEASSDEPYAPPGGRIPYDKATGKPIEGGLTKGMARDRAIMSAVVFPTPNQVIQLNRLNEAEMLLRGVEKLRDQLAAGGPGSALSNDAQLRINQFFGTGSGKVLLQTVTEIAMLQGPALTGQLRPLQQSVENLVKSSPSARDTVQVWNNFINLQHAVIDTARRGVFQQDTSGITPNIGGPALTPTPFGTFQR